MGPCGAIVSAVGHNAPPERNPADARQRTASTPIRVRSPSAREAHKGRSMKTYSAIKAEIAKLEKQAEALRKSEVAGVVAKIKSAIDAYGLTPADLGFGSGSARPARQTKGKSGKKPSKTVGVAKY